MSSTVTSTASAMPTSLLSGLNSGGSGQKANGQSFAAFISAVAAGLAVFGVEFGIFLLINGHFSRIYQPRTFLVPERERTKPPPTGLWQWLLPVFQTSNAEFIQKCGLDAYFFLRYLRTLLKIFLPLAFLILPILIPLNYVHGRGSDFASGEYSYSNTYTNVTGLDRLAWGNVRPTKNSRYWAHLVLALVVITYTCFTLFDELRTYIRLRQAYLTSPQHRLRASATTVLVTAIPTKWCTYEALDALYDVYPGGIKNIWINRDFDDLSDKVKWRNRLASALESAETNMIRNAKKANMKKVRADNKKAAKRSASIESAEIQVANESGVAMAQTDGISSGNPHQIHTLDEVMEESSNVPSRERSQEREKRLIPIPVLGQGIEAVGHGIDNIGKTVLSGLKKATGDVDKRLNTTGFVPPTPETAFDQSGVRFNEHPDVAPTSSTSEPDNHYQEHDARQQRHVSSEHWETARNNGINQSDMHEESEERHPRGDSAKQGLAIDGAPLDPRVDGDDTVEDVLENRDRPQAIDEGQDVPKLKFWKRKKKDPFGIPSPTPFSQEEDEFPLSRPSPMTPGCNPQATINGKGATKLGKISSKKESKSDTKHKNSTEYVTAINAYDPNEGHPKWEEYIKKKDRETMRLPIFGWHWMPSIPLIGKKVDCINYCRKEVARLNLEIEEDQKNPEKYPLMNSAFVQFNHQVAAHMACQAVSHHTPGQMAPRLVEISPDDVIWDNMSIKWWESYLRVGAVLVLITVLIAFWAVPVTFTGLLSNLTYLSTVHGFSWIAKIPAWFRAVLQGILPQVLLAVLLLLLPFIMRFLAKSQGDHTGMAVELSVQTYYFGFLFFQLFFVVSISSGITTIIPEIAKSPGNVPSLLAENLPRASNYFFSYMLLQALSVSAGALVQIGGLVSWFVLAPILDSTARQKWSRQITLPNMQWGTFFPVYTNLACIGLIYSVISPLMMVFNVITFSLFWFVYRYNTLYVTKFRFDTGGLLYPKALNQLFVGIYFMELVLIGLFLLVRDSKSVQGPNGQLDQLPDGSSSPCKGQAIIMIVVFILTGLYQWLLNSAFGPLIRYLPITLEDEAVERDKEFERAQEKRWMLEANGEEEGQMESVAREGTSPVSGNTHEDEDVELRDLKSRKEYYALDPRNVGQKIGNLVPGKRSWADRSQKTDFKSPNPAGHLALSPRQPHRPHQHRNKQDLEGQRVGTNAMGEALFAGINDEIEDLTPEERDKLVQRAFQHEALRARRPVIWIPRDDIGVSDDEIRRTQKYSKYIWISNEHAGLDGKANVIYRRSPPDFSEIDLIEL